MDPTLKPTIGSNHGPSTPPRQVYLRITLSKSRAEVLQLEALENIAACMAPKERRTPSGRQQPGGGRTASRLRLDLFRAVSFARKLAESLEHTLGKAEGAGGRRAASRGAAA